MPASINGFSIIAGTWKTLYVGNDAASNPQWRFVWIQNLNPETSRDINGLIYNIYCLIYNIYGFIYNIYSLFYNIYGLIYNIDCLIY